MKNLKLLLPVILAAVIFTGCSSGYGSEYKLDSKHSIYYKGDGVDEAHAKKLAEYLKAQNYFQDSIDATVQVIKVKDTFNVNFVVNETKLTPGYETIFLFIGGLVSENVFSKAPVVVQLTNNKLEPFKNLGYAGPISGDNEE